MRLTSCLKESTYEKPPVEVPSATEKTVFPECTIQAKGNGRSAVKGTPARGFPKPHQADLKDNRTLFSPMQIQ